MFKEKYKIDSNYELDSFYHKIQSKGENQIVVDSDLNDTDVHT